MTNALSPYLLTSLAVVVLIGWGLWLDWSNER